MICGLRLQLCTYSHHAGTYKVGRSVRISLGVLCTATGRPNTYCECVYLLPFLGGGGGLKPVDTIAEPMEDHPAQL